MNLCRGQDFEFALALVENVFHGFTEPGFIADLLRAPPGGVDMAGAGPHLMAARPGEPGTRVGKLGVSLTSREDQISELHADRSEALQVPANRTINIGSISDAGRERRSD